MDSKILQQVALGGGPPPPPPPPPPRCGGPGSENCKTASKRISSDKRAGFKSISSFIHHLSRTIRQDDYINRAVRIDWQGSPSVRPPRLLNSIESPMRVREEKNGPRVIDLDILMYGDGIIDNDRLTIPHRELHRRRSSP